MFVCDITNFEVGYNVLLPSYSSFCFLERQYCFALKFRNNFRFIYNEKGQGGSPRIVTTRLVPGQIPDYFKFVLFNIKKIVNDIYR